MDVMEDYFLKYEELKSTKGLLQSKLKVVRESISQYECRMLLIYLKNPNMELNQQQTAIINGIKKRKEKKLAKKMTKENSSG